MQRRKASKNSSKAALEHAARIIYPICCLAGSPSLLDQVQREGTRKTLRDCIEDLDTPGLFDWLIVALSYQGVSDQAASTYIAKHGSVTWSEIDYRLSLNPPCPKLRSYWHFDRCGYSKWKQTCACPDYFSRCPLPKHRLRNGRLNELAYALFFFLRDVTGSDLVGWIDGRLEAESATEGRARVRAWQVAVLGPLRHIYGVADKVLNMAFASVLLAAQEPRTHWRELGASLISIDSLVHQLLKRSGILRRFGAEHNYGPACYEPNGCAEIIFKVSQRIDARAFNKSFPASFPRFVQHSLWRYCAQDGLNICNSVRIDDRLRCADTRCRLYRRCDRRPVLVK